MLRIVRGWVHVHAAQLRISARVRAAEMRRAASTNDVSPEVLERLRHARAQGRAVREAQPASRGSAPRRIPAAAPTSNPKAAAPLTLSPPGRLPDATLICHELDRRGVLHVHSGRFQKSELCSSLGLLPRDLRKLDGTLKSQLPAVLVRDSAVLVNMDPIRAIIKHDGVILFENVELEVRMPQHEFMLQLQARLCAAHDHHTPFEFVVLEMVLQRTLQSLQEHLDAMQPEIEEHLRALENIVHWERLKVLLACKKRVTLFHERVENVRACIKELLESDADMAAMYLSEKAAANAPARPPHAHEEIELLLESYLKMAEEIASRTQILVSDMQSTEDIVNIALVGQRNEFLLFELRLGIGTFAASMGGFGASVLGMNLHTGYEHSPHAFWLILTTLLSLATTSFLLLWRRMLRLIRHK